MCAVCLLHCVSLFLGFNGGLHETLFNGCRSLFDCVGCRSEFEDFLFVNLLNALHAEVEEKLLLLNAQFGEILNDVLTACFKVNRLTERNLFHVVDDALCDSLWDNRQYGVSQGDRSGGVARHNLHILTERVAFLCDDTSLDLFADRNVGFKVVTNSLSRYHTPVIADDAGRDPEVRPCVGDNLSHAN